MKDRFFQKIVTFSLVALLSCAAYSLPAFASESKIPDDVTVEGLELGGRTKEEAKEILTDYVNRVTSGTLRLTDTNDQSWDISFGDIGVKLADDSVIDNISDTGSGTNILKRYEQLRSVQNAKDGYRIDFVCDKGRLTDMLQKLSSEVNTEPEDAILVRHGGQLIITREVNGQTLKIGETADHVLQHLTSDWDRGDITAEMVLEVEKAQHTEEELSVIQDVLGTYTTSFWGSSNNRIENIKTAAAKVDETVLYPGETFSTLDAILPFTEENGYHMAGSYASGKNVDSMGGGVCQVSSTLYNAVLRAELTVVERLNHMMTVGYVPLAADATMAEPTVDFVFRNDYDYPVYIESYTYNGSMTVAIYGKEERPEGRTVEFESVTEQTMEPGPDIVTEDPTQYVGYEQVTQSAHTGYVAALYKLVYVDGVLESRELVNRSTYNAYPRYVTRGTKPVETAAPETTDSGTLSWDTATP